MAKQIEFDKFLIIECTAGELMDAVGSTVCMCDDCGRPCTTSERGFYIAVLNRWFCKRCYDSWAKRAHWYAEDARIERKNFEFYAPRFGIKCQ